MNTKYFLFGCLILFATQTTFSMNNAQQEQPFDHQQDQRAEGANTPNAIAALRESPFSARAAYAVSLSLYEWIKSGVQDCEATRTQVLKIFKILGEALEERVIW